jgi:hypothetical protein
VCIKVQHYLSFSIFFLTQKLVANFFPNFRIENQEKVGHKGFKFNGCGLINHPALTGTPPAEGNSEPRIGL